MCKYDTLQQNLKIKNATEYNRNDGTLIKGWYFFLLYNLKN